MELRQVMEQHRVSLDEFARGDPRPLKNLVSHRDDVTWANPFGPAVRGWRQVSDALDYASSRMRDGKVTGFETIAEYESPELVTILEVERWEAKVGGRADVIPWDLRVTTTFRREDGDWKIVARHADPRATFDPNGPLRNANS